METEREQWLRAHSLYTQVLGLGPNSSHRADALFALGWIEYRLGNRVQSRNHFDCFNEHYRNDERAPEARALSLVCRAEDAYSQGERLIEKGEMDLLAAAACRFEEAIILIENNLHRIQNHAYRSILQDLAMKAALSLLPYLEEYSEFQRSDHVYGLLRRIIGYANTDLALCDLMSQLIVDHARAAQAEVGEEHRKIRARSLLRRMTQELSAMTSNKPVLAESRRMDVAGEDSARNHLPNIGRQTTPHSSSHPRGC